MTTTHRKWDEIRAQRDAEPGIEERRRQARDELLGEIAAYEAGLAELRRARGLTQIQLAEQLGTSQGEISKIEHRNDLYLSTLNRYLEAMGGELRLVGVFDDERVVVSLRDALDELVQTPTDVGSSPSTLTHDRGPATPETRGSKRSATRRSSRAISGAAAVQRAARTGGRSMSTQGSGSGSASKGRSVRSVGSTKKGQSSPRS